MNTENKKLIIYSIIGLVLGLLLLFVPKQVKLTSQSESYRLYKIALELHKEGDFQNAYYNFSKVGKNSKLYNFALYRQALAAKELKDYKSAVKKFKKYIEVEKDPMFVPVGYWELGEIYRSENFQGKNTRRASKYFKKLQKKYPKSDFAAAANFRLGQILVLQNENKQRDNKLVAEKLKWAQAYFIKYLDNAPTGRFSLDAIDKIADIGANGLNADERVILANAMYENGKYDDSIKILNSIINEKKWYLLGKNYVKTKKIDYAKSAFVKYLQTAKTEDGAQINDCISSYMAISGTNKFDNYKKLLAEVKNPITINGILFAQAQLLPRGNSVAIANYNKIYKQNSGSYFASESLWEIFWNFYRAGKFKEALKIAQQHEIKFKNTNSSAKVLYYTGKIFVKNGDKKKADSFFKKIFDNYPDNYYAYRANEYLTRERRQFSTFRGIKFKEQPKVIALPIKSEGLSELLMMKDFDAIESFKIQDEFLKSWIARSKGNESYSITLARNEMSKLPIKPNENDPRWLLLYPVFYAKTVNTMAEDNKLSTELVMAIIREESGFDPNAKSSAGAMGLMQLMPATAKFIDPANYKPEKLKDPNYNIYVGSKYLASLLKQFGGDEIFAIASYNGGIGNVLKWKEQFYNGDQDEFVENIPFPETQNYVKKVFASYWNYLRIYKTGT